MNYMAFSLAFNEALKMAAASIIYIFNNTIFTKCLSQIYTLALELPFRSERSSRASNFDLKKTR